MRIELLPKDFALDYFEFNITGDNESYNKGDAESRYLDGDVFNLFARSFEASNQLFEFDGQTKYNSKNIIPLRNELYINLESLEKITDLCSFESFVEEAFLGPTFLQKIQKEQPNWKENWKTLLDNLIKVNKDLLRLIDVCLDEDRVLWVIGF